MTIFDALNMICGLALFLYGMQLMGESLKKSAGNRLKTILADMTSSPVRGFLLGFVVTAIIQSSSATTVMVVGFVNSGTMTLLQSVGVIMGANVGAAVTFWLTGLSGLGEGAVLSGWLEWVKPTAWMPLLALVGIILMMFFKRGKKRDIGATLIGFSILMVGMEMMGSSVSGLKNSPEFIRLMTVFSNPILGLLTGALITAVIQSSAASVGILQSLSTTGVISYGMALPIILGQNIGTCITALLSSLGANKDGKRAALIHLSFNVLGGGALLLLYMAATALFDLDALTARPIGMFGIAGVHTAVKLLAVALLAPFYRKLEQLSRVLIRDEKNDKTPAHLLDERLFTTPSVAVERATQVTCQMAQISCRAFTDALQLLSAYDAKLAESIRDMEGQADVFEDELGTYLVKLSGCNTDMQDSRQITKLLHMLGDFERISDHAVNVVESAEEMVEKKIAFSAEAERELSVMRGAVEEIIGLAARAFLYNDVATAVEVEPLEQVVDDLRDRIKANHIERLQKSECTIEHGFILSDILTNYERVADHCSNIAECVIEISCRGAMDVHRYLTEIKKDDASFEKMYQSYRRKYSL